MAKTREGAEFSCSFCGKHQSQVNKLIAGPAIMICDECVAACAEMAPEGGGGVQSTNGLVQVPNPPEAYRLLPFLMRAAKLRVQPTCNFCGNPGPHLVQPPSTLVTHALICSECVTLCQDIIREQLG